MNSLRKPVHKSDVQRAGCRRVRNAVLGAIGLVAVLGSTSLAHADAAPQTPQDFDGDGKTDKTVWTPSTGQWWWIDSADGQGWVSTYGLPGDVPVTADFDGDGRVDRAVFRPSTGYWYWVDSYDGQGWQQLFGMIGDVPVPGDYDGDGTEDRAIWRPKNGDWAWYNSSNGQSGSRQWGIAGDIAVPGDYDSDGHTDLAVWRESNGVWYVINSTTQTSWAQQWGMVGDVPVPGDYDNDGKTDIAVWRPSNGVWYIVNSSSWTYWTQQWGVLGDIPVPGDYDNDGKTDIAIWRPSTGQWWVIQSTTWTYTLTTWGTGGASQGGLTSDIPLPYIPQVRNILPMQFWSQQQSNWCWAASEQMVAAYSALTLTQCQNANFHSGRTDCCTNPGACNFGGCFTMTNHGFTETVLSQLNCGGLTPTGNSALTFNQITAEFNAGRPVAFAWSWTGGGGHELVALGSWNTSDGQQWVTVYDPGGNQIDMTYADWVSGPGYLHQRDTYNIVRQ